MSVGVQKFTVSINKKHVTLILRLCHKGTKLKTCEPTGTSCQSLNHFQSKKLPLPLNFRHLPSSEGSAFSKERTRDILGTYLAARSASGFVNENDSSRAETDLRAEKYICSGSVDLSSSMQTNVPQPFRANVRFTHLNMPRGQWRQEAKYISEQLNSFHYVNTRSTNPLSLVQSKCFYSSEKKISESGEISKTVHDFASAQNQEVTKTEKLKKAIQEYGSIILALHIGISLASLGMCYFLIQSGFKLEDVIKQYGLTDGAGVVSSAGPFIVAYAVHKVFAPFRIGITLTLTPFVVRFLRKRGFKINVKLNKVNEEKQSERRK